MNAMIKAFALATTMTLLALAWVAPGETLMLAGF